MKNRLTLLSITFGLLSAAILLTIYGMWFFYPQEIHFLNLETSTQLSSQTIQYNFNVLMQYLTNPLRWTLSMPDFRSSVDGLHHFEVVKLLFHVAQLVFLVNLPIVYVFFRKLFKEKMLAHYKNWFLICLLLPIGIGIFAILIGFNQFFVLFHQLLFVGDETWMFDPNKDPVIRILPELFFLHAFSLFFLLYEGIFGFFYYKISKKSTF
ncbi:integral membrane protein [Streptococcus sp. DD10]|uniref:TIGR01906 family membrane protein n=1 Tax=Streptococcus sp. DD10 TaxID=1777878 RepID=UPI00079C2742|nr:TIGR01906 family membrane protein [Streptococcus sp. DD10]KXT73361.1 integral membrane protein [Streptococcus sp. DD10]